MKKIFTTLLFIITIQFGYSQSLSKLGFKWKKPEATTPVPEQFKNEDVVTLTRDLTISNMYDFSSRIPFFSYYSVRQRYHVQTKEGLEKISQYEIYKVNGSTPVTIDSRTIKKDGSTIETNRESIKELKKYDNDRREYRSVYRLAVPGAEVGDDIEIIYSVRRDYLTYSADIFLNDEFAILKSTFTLNTYLGIVTDVFNHNGMPEMANTNTPEKTIMKWELKNLLPLNDQNYCVNDNELPFIRLRVKSLNFPQLSFPYQIGLTSWSEVYDMAGQNAYNKDSKAKGMEKYIQSLSSELSNLGTIGKIQYFTDMVNKDFDIVNILNEKERDMNLVEQIKLRKSDNENMILFYKYLLYNLKIPYSMVLAKNKYNGQLTADEITPNQITDVFYEFKDEKGATHYLYPSDNYTRYHIDELPFYLEDTRAILLTKADPFDNIKADVKYTTIGHINPSENVRNINCHYTLNKDGSASAESKASYTGMPSTYFRKGWSELIKNYDSKKIVEWLDESDSLSFQFDSLILEQAKTVFPFNFDYRLKFKAKDVVSEAGDNIFSAKIKVSPNHFIFNYSNKQRTTAAFYPFAYTDILSAFIEFPSDVTIINEADLNKQISNEVGSFERTLTKVSPKIYKLTSTYKFNQPNMQKNTFSKYVDLNEFVKQHEEINLLYK